jgi:hypothetical protein
MSSWKARLLMALTILTMLLTMSAAPAMANDFGHFNDGRFNDFGRFNDRIGFLGDFDDCDHFDCDDDEGVDVVPVDPGECVAVVDEDHPNRSRLLCAPGVPVQ